MIEILLTLFLLNWKGGGEHGTDFSCKNLTLKAKGLLSLMLSLPDDWNYNMQGLATLSRDGIDSVRSAIKELEHHGYVERHRLRNEYGFYGDTEYIIREVPLGEEND